MRKRSTEAKPVDDMVTEIRSLLNKDQARAFDLAMSGVNVFIGGAGGVGKSFTLKAIQNAFEAKHMRCLICAPTGVAAQLDGGSTLHRLMGWKNDLAIIGVTKSGKKQWKVMADKRLSGCDVLFIDEISMVRLDMADSLAVSIAKANKVRAEVGKPPIILIIFGDFFQLQPVVTKVDRARLEDFYGRDIMGGYPFLADHWDDFNFTYAPLTEVVRQDTKLDKLFLNALREGCNDPYIIRKLYEATSSNSFDGAPFLFTKVRKCEAYNRKKMAELPGKAEIFECEYTGELKAEMAKAKRDLSQDEYEKMERAIGGYDLEIKRGTRVMFTANSIEGVNWFEATVAEGDALNHVFQNGTVGIVRDFHKGGKPSEDWVEVEIIEDDRYDVVKIKRIEHPTSEYKAVGENGWWKSWTGSWWQLGIRVAFGLTYHKCQGMTLQYVNVDPSEIFSTSMLYVALSRATSLSHIYLTQPIDPNDIRVDEVVVNYYRKLEGKSTDYKPDYSELLEAIKTAEAKGELHRDDDIPADLDFDEYGRVQCGRKTSQGNWADYDDDDGEWLPF